MNLKELRERKNITQQNLADKLGVTAKAVSKWETGKGLPDICLLEPLARELEVSLEELMGGRKIENLNRPGNLTRGKFYVCPMCGNVVYSVGEAMISCCGISLPPLTAEDMEDNLTLEKVEDETYIHVDHPMTKDHYISFIAYVRGDKAEINKMYPEGEAQTRMKIRGHGYIYIYCNRHGLFKMKV
ncbi:MAG: helix-turn-helix domain-containing protein [Clostridia bacterium]|nr:helix-turn-helix domain-containing protein [Clostridia bacterium]